MNIAEMVDERLVSFAYEAETKDDVLNGLGQMMYDAGKVSSVEEYVKGLYQREEELATGIGNQIAIPHCKSDCVREAAFTLVKLAHPVEWESIEDEPEPVNYVIMLAAPNTADNVHLSMLSSLAANLMDDDFREGLFAAQSVEEIRRLFNEQEAKELSA